MEVHGDPIFDETGNVKMMIEYSFDVTDRKKAEQALLKTEQELKKKLEESEKFTKFAVNRELKMVELKKTIEALKKELAESFSDK